MDYIEQYLDYTKAYESPTEFFYWAAIAGISATLRNRCYLLLGDTRIYPNLYILIVAKPAMRKDKPLTSTIALCKLVDNTKIVEGRTSIQAVIQRLGEIENHKGITVSGASGLIFSREISAMFTEDEANIPILTDLYDYQPTYDYTLISRPTTRLKDVVLSLFGASNEELLKPVLNNRAIYGGLLSRCLIVYGDKVRHRNSLMYEDPEDYGPKQIALSKQLRRFSELNGIIRVEDSAKKHYHEWYNDVVVKLEDAGGATGAEGRIHTNVLKVAISLTVSRTASLIIEKPDIITSIDKCQSLFVNYRRFTMGIGKSRINTQSVTVLKLLWDSRPTHTLTRREVLYSAWGDIDSKTLDEVCTTLEQAGMLEYLEHRGDAALSQLKLTSHAIATFTNSGV